MNRGSSQASEDLPPLNTLNDLPSNVPVNKILSKPPKSWLDSGRFIKNKDATLRMFSVAGSPGPPHAPGLVNPRPGRRWVSPGVCGVSELAVPP